MKTVQTAAFRQRLYRWYARHGRSLPWRRTHNPYRILVSEVMLQQTQVDRVLPFYGHFLKDFPTVRALARAPQSAVLRSWQGLGYNRRALLLHRAAKAIAARHEGRVPREEEALRALPGIGSYTARAILAFAFDRPVVLIETNIRSVFIHEFFPGRRRVADREILPLIEQTVDRRRPRRWYSALMDYGSALKREVENPSRQSAHHARQLPFRGSMRELRGTILALAARRRFIGVSDIRAALPRNPAEVQKCLRVLFQEGFLVRSGSKFRLK